MNHIVEIAKRYIGERETPNNSGFKDEIFQKKMEEVGWLKGQAWCSYAVELIWKEAMPEKFDELDKLCNASAVKTYSNFKKSENFICDHIPEPGAIVIWQHYKNGLAEWMGHAGIVASVGEKTIITIEGNTNSKGGREGIEVAEKIRNLDFETEGKTGLILKGFIKPKNI